MVLLVLSGVQMWRHDREQLKVEQKNVSQIMSQVAGSDWLRVYDSPHGSSQSLLYESLNICNQQ